MLSLDTASLAIEVMAGDITRVRYTGSGWLSNGVFDESASSSTSTIKAVLQAPSEKDMRLLPEGERVEAYVTVWTRAELRPSDEATGIRADEVIGFDGTRYRVVKVAQRTDGGFTRAIARLARNDAERSL